MTVPIETQPNDTEEADRPRLAAIAFRDALRQYMPMSDFGDIDLDSDAGKQFIEAAGRATEPLFRKIDALEAERCTADPPRTDHCLFAEAMALELAANAGKGDFSSWEPDAGALTSEIDHHVTKLKAAMANGSAALIGEYAADLGNYAAKAYAMADRYAARQASVDPPRTEAAAIEEWLRENAR